MLEHEVLKILALSDIHLGHRRTTTQHIVDSLQMLFSNNVVMHGTNIIFIAGDVFDDLLNLPHVNVAIIQQWIYGFLRMCYERNITVRILEGTPKHDRGQSRLFITINTMLPIPADVKHIDTLSIEYIAKYNINILYVPDEWRHDNEITKKEVGKLLHDNGLTTVDYAIMHGTLPHQVPDNMHIPVHDYDYYESIVNVAIFIGHQHTPSLHGKAHAHGSFDRTAHGEEHNKGCWILEVEAWSGNIVKRMFYINENAMVYKTITLDTNDEDKIIARLNSVSELKDGSHVRVKHASDFDYMSIVTQYMQGYTGLNWTISPIKVKKDVKTGVVPKVYVPMPINRNTITEILLKRLALTDVDSSVMHAITVELDNLVGEKQ